MENSVERIENLSPLKRALLEMREMRAQLDTYEQARQEPIAVIGLGCRFPGAANGPDDLWQLLRDGVDAIRETPPDRWDADAFYDPNPETPGKLATRWGGFIEGVDRFDADFFGIVPREAISMDPQQRLLLEVSWEALEHAGQSPQELAGSPAGVFVGIGTNDYSYLRLMYADIESIDAYLAMGTSHSVASGRLSYVLGLEGPSVSLDTACSSSLLAVHMAVQSLRQQECHLALAGGVNLMLMPEMTMTLSKARMMAADGRCKTFDARADGFVRAEGCGIVVLKRLSDAVADRDNILAVVRGSATNQDGRSNGLTAPNGRSQEAVIRAALANAGVEPAQVSYVEAHGTGTSLGDPIEVQALAAVYGQERPSHRPLALGSIKTNFGHMEAGAGVAGLIKAVLALHHREIPPHLHLQGRNPFIPWEELSVTIPTERTPWPIDAPPLAGVSSFGFSGTNVHVVLEGYREQLTVDSEQSTIHNSSRPLHLLCLSARSETALREVARRYQPYLADAPADDSFANVCFTASNGRAHLTHRLAVVAAAADRAQAALSAFLSGQETEAIIRGQVAAAEQPEVAFLFTGHGAQYVDMGRQLYETQPVFRAALDECETLLRPYLERPLLSVMFNSDQLTVNSQQLTIDNSQLTIEMTYGQPAIFALEYALATLWRSWGVEPTMVLGHSVGEYVAACVAGIFSLADGLKLVAARGRLMDSLPQQGEMVAVFADETRVAAAVAPYEGQVSIAAVNGPTNIVISGEKTAVQTIVASLEVDEINYRRLAVGVAAHSPLLEPILDAFAQTAAEISYAPPQIGLISGLTGQLATVNSPQFTVHNHALSEENVSQFTINSAAYWRHHLRQPVRFADAIQTLYQEGHRHFLEIGPTPVLCGMGQRCLPEDAGGVWLPSLRRDWDDWQQLLESVAALYTQGVALDWDRFEEPYLAQRRRLPLPTYPWQHQSYWLPEIRAGQPATAGSSLWETAVAAGEHQADHGPLNLHLDTYDRREECLARLSTAYMVEALTALGLFTQVGESHTIDSLLTLGQIDPSHRSLLGRWLQKLAAQDILVAEADGHFANHDPLPELSPEDILEEALALSPDGPELPLYVARCGRKLTAVLAGRESPLETLFPGGSYETADYLYHKSPPARYCNGIAREITEALVRSLPPRQPVRIIEVGAGTGGTTAALLPVLPPERTQYTFTDMSEFFFARAEERFKAYPFLRYGLFNLEEEPYEQGYGRHSYDLVVGANVFHAVQDLGRALDHARSLLAPGGLLLLYETTQHPTWFEVSIGLIEGWSRFNDDWRQGNPLLTPDTWQKALLAHGYEAVRAWPAAGAAAETLGVHIIIAQAPVVAEWQAEMPSLPTETGDSPPSSAAISQSAVLTELEEALPEDQIELLVDFVRQRVIKVTRSSPTRVIGRRDRLMDLGVDSLMAVDLRTVLGNDLGLERPLPATLIFDYPSIEAIATYLQQHLFTAPADEAVTESVQVTDGNGTAAIEEMSDEEVEALLLQKLGEI